MKLNCPRCAQLSIERKLVLKQINLDTAVYLCPDVRCTYPEGFQWITVTRTLKQMLQDHHKRKKKRKINSDRLLDSICGPAPDRKQSKCPEQTDFDLDSLLNNEIDKLQCSTEVSVSADGFDLDSLFMERKQEMDSSNDDLDAFLGLI